MKNRFLIWIAAILASLVACSAPAEAGSFTKSGSVINMWIGLEGGAWESLIETTYVTEFCIGINHIERVESGTATNCDDNDNARNAMRFSTDVWLIDFTMVASFEIGANDECAFRWATDAGTVGISDELEVGISVHVGGTVLGPITIGHLLPAGEALFLQARETDQSGDCGPSLGKQNLYLRYIEMP